MRGNRGPAEMKSSVTERFWAKVSIGGADECWNWKGTPNRYGYGQFRMDWRTTDIRHAHRVAWELTSGNIPDKLLVCHSCDNRLCCNPRHLFLGTHQENTHDAMVKGRLAKGDQLYPEQRQQGKKRKLNDLQVIGIMARVLQGASKLQTAREFGVNVITVHSIVEGKTHKHLFVREDTYARPKINVTNGRGVV